MKATMLSMLASVATAVFAGGVFAQSDGTFLLVSTNTVSPATPTTTIELWAAWEDPSELFVFGGADYDLTAGDGGFSNPINAMNGFPGATGVITGNVIRGAINGQSILCGIAGCLFSYDNPMLMATYDWTTTDFTPRTVDLDTSNTSRFIVALPFVRAVELYPSEFTPGSGVITVIPAPAAWFIFSAPFAMGVRRPRR